LSSQPANAAPGRLFDVVVPTFNNANELRGCLDSLERQTLTDFRVLVCVDGSTDGTAELLDRRESSFPMLGLWHPERSNKGRAATRNLALPHLDSTFVVFLDSDMELEPEAIERHATVLEGEPCASVGSITYRNTSTNLWARYLSVRRLNRWKQGARLPFNQFAGANIGLRTADFRTLNGFDERLAGYGGEDGELGYRLAHELQRPIISNPAARAMSTELKTLDMALQEFRAFGRDNLHYLHSKHPSMPHVFFTDRLSSHRLRDRLFVAVMNPLTDRVVGAVLPVMPFVVQHQLINYQVIRAISRGYLEGVPAPAR
jgi:glycosyltransferase involved in cell wall biosynthesis